MSSGNVSAFLTQPLPQPTAGAAIAYQNLLEVTAASRVFPCVATDYAAAADQGSVILAKTNLTGANLGANSPSRGAQPCARGPDGSLYVLTNPASGSEQGIKLTRFSLLGQQLASVVVDNSGGNLVTRGFVMVMPNGNVAVAYFGVTQNAKYAVYDQFLLNVVQAVASPTGGNVANAAGISAAQLAGGGFALFYGTAATTSSLSVYDSSGAQTATVSVASTGGSPQSALGQESGGNLVLTWNPGAAGTFQYAIYNTSAVQQLAPASTGITRSALATPRVAFVPGFFAIAAAAGSTTLSVSVFSNVGAQQGSTQNYTVPSSPDSYGDILGDTNNVQFWAYFCTGSPFVANYAEISTAGVTLATFQGSTIDEGTQISSIDALGNIVTCGAGTSTSLTTTFDVNLKQTVTAAGNIDAGVSGIISECLPVGDGVGLFYGQFDGTQAAYIKLMKYADTAILGPAITAAAVASPAPLDDTNGYKIITSLLGSPTKAFNHSATHIIGNSGTLQAGGGASMKGM